MVTLLQLRDQTRNRLGVATTDGFFEPERLNDAINAAIATLESERKWPWQERLVNLNVPDATGDVPLPSDFQSARAVWYGEDEVDFLPAYDLLPYADAVGAPTAYSIVASTLKLVPRPEAGATIRLLYARAAGMLTKDSDSLEMPPNAYPAIVAKAAQLLSTAEDDRPAAAGHLLEYDQWVTRLLRQDRSSSRPAGRRIRPGNWV